MAVTVTFPTVLARHAGGTKSHSVTATTVGDALTAVTKNYPELAKRLAEATSPDNAFVTIYLNDEDARFLGGLNTPVRDGDEISIVSAIAGG